MNSKSPAGRRYLARMIPMMVIYTVAIIGVSMLFNSNPPQGLLRYVFAVLPAIPTVGVIWAVGMYLHEETDEYLRMRLAVTSLWATGVTLSAATIWGFLEQFDTVQHIPLYYVFILYWASFGVIQGIHKVTEGGSGQ